MPDARIKHPIGLTNKQIGYTNVWRRTEKAFLKRVMRERHRKKRIGSGDQSA